MDVVYSWIFLQITEELTVKLPFPRKNLLEFSEIMTWKTWKSPGISLRNILTTPIQLYYTSQYLGVSTDILCGNREKMYLNVLEYELSCTGIYWKFEIVQYWKIKNVLENVLECTGISFSILCGHPE